MNLAHALRPALAAVVASAAVATSASALPQGSTFLVSRPDGQGPVATSTTNHSFLTGRSGGGPLGPSAPQSISQDGRFVVFISAADGLVADDVDTVMNVYLRDRTFQTTTLVSRASGVAGAAGNGDSTDPAISADGRYVAFVSRSTNFSDFDEGGVGHVFLRDTFSGTTSLVDRADGASGVIANQTAASPSVADAGGTPAVVFTSTATNLLVAEAVPANTSQVYMRKGGVTTLISRRDGQTATTPNAPGNGPSSQPVISADGSTVAFTTAATNLVDTGVAGDDDTNGVDDVYIRKLALSDTAIVSLADASGQLLNSDSGSPSISPDGSRVAFVTTATNTNAADSDGSPDVYVRSGTSTLLVSRTNGFNGAKGNGTSQGPSISGDGLRVAFVSTSTNLNPADTTATQDVYMREFFFNTTRLASQVDGVVGDAPSISSAISQDGTFIALDTEADNLSKEDDDDFTRVITSDVGPIGSLDPPIVLVSRPSGSGAFQSGVNHSFHIGPTRNGVAVSGVSQDGRYVVFASADDTLSPDDDNRFVNIFVRDTLLDRLTLVSRADGVAGAAANGPSGALEPLQAIAIGAPAITPDGTKVVFTSAASNLVPGDANGTFDVFVRDLVAGTTTRVSLRPDGTEIAEGGRSGAISASGNRIAFVTSAALDPLDSNGAVGDVYLRDLAAGTTTLMSRNSAGASGNQSSAAPAISGDGSVVAFVTGSTNLTSLLFDSNGLSDVYMHTVASGETRLVSVRSAFPTGAGNGSSVTPAVNADGTRIAFVSSSDNLVAPGLDGNGVIDVYLRDFTLPTGSQTVLVSRTAGPDGVAGSAEAKSPSISADGTRIAFQSLAPQYAPGDTNGTISDVFVRDISAGTTNLVGLADGTGGAQPPDGAFAPAISGDGDCVTFTSVSDNLVGGISGRDFFRLHMRAVRGECGRPLPPPTPTPILAPGPTPDRVAPRITLLRLVPTRFRAGTRVLAATKLRPAIGTSVRFTLNERGSVRIVIHRLLPGRRLGTRCVAPRPTLKKACVRAVLRGALVRTGKVGANRIAFTGRLGTKKLVPGRYRMSVTVTDAAGNRSVIVRRVFTILR